MKLLDKVSNYLEYNNFKILITDNYILIANYEEIIDFSSTEVLVKCKNNKLKISGKDLVIDKMIDDEIEIIGKFTNVAYV